MQGGPPDTTLLWCLERLAAESLSCGTIIAVLRDITSTRGELFFNDSLRARIMLASLGSTGDITFDTLNELDSLDAVIANTAEPELATIAPALRVPSELLLQVKTELVAQTWRSNITATPRDIVLRLQQVFGRDPPPQEPDRSRHSELMAAASHPGHRMAIDRALDTRNVLNGLRRYVNQCQELLGPTLLDIINNDINLGRYIPGQQQAPPPPPPAQLYLQAGRQGHADKAGQGFRAPAPEFYGRQGNGRGYESPMQLGGRRPGGVPVLPPPSGERDFPEIRDAVMKLRAAGGRDPIAEAEALASLVAATTDRVWMEQHRGPPGSAGRDAHTPASAGLGPRPSMPRLPNTAPPSHLRPRSGARLSAPLSTPRTRINNRRVNRRWSEEETRALLDGCHKHHPGSWAAIYSDNIDLFGPPPGETIPQRSQVDLKDKWRNLIKQGNQEALQIRDDFMAENEEEMGREEEQVDAPDLGELANQAVHLSKEEEEARASRRKRKAGRRSGAAAAAQKELAELQEGQAQEEEEEEEEIYESIEEGGEGQEGEKEGEEVPAATEEQGEGEGGSGGEAEEEEEEGEQEGEGEEGGEEPTRGRGRGRKSTRAQAKTKRARK